ncbi:ABC transporter ATP-binding protein [Nitrospirillum pindoramense]|uniref:Sulfonate transport system ATP-binding protein n=1 Tax=Nitrospirillum amazonense TaxID=28077 RepID=A0A560GZZ0_9PROT|nr:ABC transporter ATP-binding protein [Nitrospirillum amazonense]TWB39605.1 sulfonate transport system ATP-binding protein [Nitrospirillum amazonense]
MSVAVEIAGLAKTYPNGLRALAGIDLSVSAGEILAIVGGSGCGKSTLLRLVAGLETPNAGSVRVGGDVVRGPHPAVGLVFQEPRLLPWLTVAENVGFGLSSLDAGERAVRVALALERVGLAEHAQAWPRELSGGQAQRAALARALVTRPQVLLLDEPFSALDALTRTALQDHLLELWAFDRPTLVLVTHDIEEALVLADRVVTLRPRPGRVDDIQTVALSRPRDRDAHNFEVHKRRLRAALNQSLAPDTLAPDSLTAAAL